MFDKLRLDFSRTRVLIVGPNASGKSSILEAIYFSFRFSPFRRNRKGYSVLINAGKERCSGRVSFSFLGIPHQISFSIDKGGAKFRFDDEPLKDKREFVIRYPVVSFIPEDILFVEGYPSYRRKFLDFMVSLGEGRMPDVYSYYRKMLKAGIYDRKVAETIQNLREEACETLNIYLSEFDVKLSFKRGKSPSVDDFLITKNGVQIRDMGSRGEKKFVALLLKLAVARSIESLRETPPLLIFDDPFSEIDESNSALLLNLLRDFPSFFVTFATSREGGSSLPDFLKDVLSEVQLIEVPS